MYYTALTSLFMWYLSVSLNNDTWYGPNYTKEHKEIEENTQEKSVDFGNDVRNHGC